MSENEHNLNQNFRFFSFSKYTVFLIIIIGISLLIRFYYFPTEVPLNVDALYYFWYSSDIYQIGELPKDWSPKNNGWPIFVSFFFTILDSKDVFALMQFQRILTVVISVLITIPVYFLCKKFVANKFAIIGASLVAFDPRLMINSFLGVTDPLYLLLISTSLTLFLYSNKKTVYISFIVVSLATTIRGEGVFFIILLIIMFFVKYRKEKFKIIFRYVLILGILMMVILPISLYRIEVTNSDGIILRSFEGGKVIASRMINNSQDDNSNKVILGFEILIKYFVWVLIPNFIIFIPLGFFLIFKNRNFEKNTIILSIGIMLLPAFYAYNVPAMDTRYLYVLYPMFSVLSVLSIEKITSKINRSNIIIIVIISTIIISSILFYDHKKIDYEHEKESFQIMNKISTIIKGVNDLNHESTYFVTSETIRQWPELYKQMKFKQTIISSDNYNSLEKYLTDSKNKGLTHIIIDGKEERPEFLRQIFLNEENYVFLEKVYDSKLDGYDYHVKVFKINYSFFDKNK